MDHVDITYRLRRIGKTQADIAHTLGVSPAVVSNVIHGRTTSFSVASYIAMLVNQDITTLWPDKYVFKPRANQKKRNI
ncbi:helix-turn-helix domain-containing protein [Tatumella terrea]|uniref:Helix-turn-helix domain-containing protein n=1 Tax=Tatumella terrea TaxID=419007 RepID=A0ABW1VWA0_9GAMM